MISELVQVESFFGRREAALTLEQLIDKFGQDPVRDALSERKLELRCLSCRTYAVLTEKARMPFSS